MNNANAQNKIEASQDLARADSSTINSGDAGSQQLDEFRRAHNEARRNTDQLANAYFAENFPRDNVTYDVSGKLAVAAARKALEKLDTLPSTVQALINDLGSSNPQTRALALLRLDEIR